MLASLSARQKITIVIAALAAGAALYSGARWRTESDFKPLVTGLAPEDAAAVVQKLKESGADYRLSDAGVVSVPSSKVAEMRLELAAAGLPKTGRIGFEIFDKTNLGATDFVEHVNYRRALEGELERSLAAMAEVEQARVHVTFPKDSVFVDAREAAKASVMLKLKPGARLSPRNVMAVGHLVASAVEGLSPDAVSVVDMQGNLLSRPARNAEEEASEQALEYRQKVERDYLQKIADTLDPLLGHDHYRAGISADCDLTSGEQSEETLDPSHSVMVSSQKTEDVTNGGGSSAAGGVPGTASNLPRPAAKPSGGGSSTTRRTESVNYETSRLVRKTKLPQGAIKRVSVAILLDHAVRWEGGGPAAKRVLDPPSPETIKTVKDVVTAVIGFSQERGDQITVESLPFENTLNQQPPEPARPVPPSAVPPPGPPALKDLVKNRPVMIGIAAGVVILLAVMVLLVRGRRKKPMSASVPQALPPGETERAIGVSTAAEQLQAKLAEQARLAEEAEIAALASIKIPPIKTQKTEVLVKQLRENAKKDVSASVHILQTWIHDRN